MIVRVKYGMLELHLKGYSNQKMEVTLGIPSQASIVTLIGKNGQPTVRMDTLKFLSCIPF
jgi:hypothetical protein